MKDNFKTNPEDFTRNRKQSFSGTILFMLNFLTRSLSIEIVNFLSFLKRKDIAQETFSKSAFVQARKKIKPEVFKHLNQRIIEEFYKDNSGVLRQFDNLRILAMDGSRLTLPFTKELEEIYGQTKNQTNTYIVQTKACVLYDLLNEICINGILSSIDTDERTQAKQLLEHCQANDLIIYDRGYPSFELIYEHYQKNLHFLMRMPLDFSQVVKDFVASGKTSQIVEIKPGQKKSFENKPYTKSSTLKIRLLRITLNSGGIEVLATSLLDSKHYGNEVFKELYFKRWKIETYYDELKNKLKIEEFSGYSNQSILQDFYSTLFVSNIQTLIENEINEEIEKESETKNIKYQYKINTTLSYGFMKDRILELFFTKNDMNDIINELKELFKKHLIPIRPDRKFERKIGKYRTRTKPIVTKNQKNSL
ncbi:IS4 family transposase [Flavobacterium sp. HXWNR69]|uniref:IS4 family transposase n=2 Tax=Flavobacterium TaxID=237 RepID=A0ABT0TFL8_9FLAO|nr:IS4 family transposase [Flavobacterium sp. HXWNR69]MCL9769780.1 IS4 family transposase [Flavobacterium sp. HXWNR69]